MKICSYAWIISYSELEVDRERSSKTAENRLAKKQWHDVEALQKGVNPKSTWFVKTKVFLTMAPNFRFRIFFEDSLTLSTWG